MSDRKFSEQQLQAINLLRAALQTCQQLEIHISGILEFDVKTLEDAEGNDYAAFS
ncbi:hypothetical protein [Pedobacter frigoris]|uniref:hypothetical protein n=1 Tax=Pedobacter frigoris TaxID=2571272 RepID=UPI00292CEF1B|nr:hypothetical protein [Pedobacter frigoris]